MRAATDSPLRSPRRAAPSLARLATLGLAALAALGTGAALEAKEVPYLAGHVNDMANLIAPEARQRIEQKLTQYEQETGHQIVVLTVDSLEGDPIEDYSLRVAEAWKLGTKEKDDGALLLVSKGDRKMRIEVGYGLEANLTDLQTQIIQQEVIIPYFKGDDYGGGIEKGVDAIVDTLKGKEPQAAAPPRAAKRGGRVSPGFLLFLLFFLLPFSAEAIQRRSWMLYLLFMPFYFFVGWLVAPVVGWILAGLWAVIFPILRTVLPKGGGRGGPGSWGGRSSGGWWLGGGGFGGGGGSWGGSGGGGGGGFSGGGGSFGGGGSSSSW